MRLERARKSSGATGAFRARVLMLCVLLVLGGALGIAVYEAVAAQSNGQLRAYIEHYASLSAQGDTADLLAVLAVYLRYPLLICLSAFSAVGLATIPVLCAAQGFSLSFAICCFVGALERAGLLLALAAFGMRCCIALPCTLCLAAIAIEQSFRRTATGRDIGKRQADSSTGGLIFLCFAVLLSGIAAEMIIVPKLVSLALNSIF